MENIEQESTANIEVVNNNVYYYANAIGAAVLTAGVCTYEAFHKSPEVSIVAAVGGIALATYNFVKGLRSRPIRTSVVREEVNPSNEAPITNLSDYR